MSNTIRQPGEWETHTACWLAWPSAANLWEENLRSAQSEFTSLCRAIADFGESLKILVPDQSSASDAERSLKGLPVQFYRIPFGDIWLRDTAPIFLKRSTGEGVASTFRFNGWGGKYELPHDSDVSIQVARAFGGARVEREWVLEGGSIESDGEGTLLTSRQCLLNPNRNPDLRQADIEGRLKEDLGAEKILWVTDGLVNDHTDGHIDTIVRFVAPGEVAVMVPSGDDGPNARIYAQIIDELTGQVDARGRTLKIHRIPSPGRVENEDGEIMPASYLNFYIANRGVVVPVYGTEHDEAAALALTALFPGRQVRALPAKAILSGGGAFHCITQQEPV